jgi:hypothetical protein
MNSRTSIFGAGRTIGRAWLARCCKRGSREGEGKKNVVGWFGLAGFCGEVCRCGGVKEGRNGGLEKENPEVKM